MNMDDSTQTNAPAISDSVSDSVSDSTSACNEGNDKTTRSGVSESHKIHRRESAVVKSPKK